MNKTMAASTLCFSLLFSVAEAVDEMEVSLNQ